MGDYSVHLDTKSSCIALVETKTVLRAGLPVLTCRSDFTQQVGELTQQVRRIRLRLGKCLGLTNMQKIALM